MLFPLSQIFFHMKNIFFGMKKQYFVCKFNQNFLLITAGSDYLLVFFASFRSIYLFL
jgi:hypothetical protein